MSIVIDFQKLCLGNESQIVILVVQLCSILRFDPYILILYDWVFLI